MATPSAKKTAWQKIRKTFNDIHLWLGLTSGLVVIAVCLSGTIYVYNTELTERAAPHLYKVSVPGGADKISVDELAGQLTDSFPGYQLTSVYIPESHSRSYRFSLKKEGDKEARPVTYFVNPYTGDILGNSNEKNGTKEFMGKMFSLHRWLLLDKVEKPMIKGTTNRELGSMITGWATILFTLGCITGLVIWFPQKVKHWRQGLKIKWKASWKRLNHDLHNTLAFYALIFLLLMGLTGPQWSFDWYRTGLQKTLGTYKSKEAPKEKTPESTTPDSAEVLRPALEQYIAVADTALPYTGDYNMTIPAEPKGTISISKNKTGFFAPAAADRITLDQYTAAVLKKDIFRQKPFNQRVAGSIKALHVGNVYGGFTKILYFLACLIATTLPITGTLIWINKWKQKKRKAGKQHIRETSMQQDCTTEVTVK